jgi:hypothetical protein
VVETSKEPVREANAARPVWLIRTSQALAAIRDESTDEGPEDKGNCDKKAAADKSDGGGVAVIVKEEAT